MDNVIETGNSSVVMAPQFDLKKLKPGVAIAIKSNDRNKWYGFNHNCLVVQAYPLKIEVIHVVDPNKLGSHDDEESSMTNRTTIPIDLVADDTLVITYLAPKKED